MLNPSLAYYFDSVCKPRNHPHGVDGIVDCMLNQFALLRVKEFGLNDRESAGL